MGKLPSLILATLAGTVTGAATLHGVVLSWGDSGGWTGIFLIFLLPIFPFWFAGMLALFEAVGQAMGRRVPILLAGCTFGPWVLAAVIGISQIIVQAEHGSVAASVAVMLVYPPVLAFLMLPGLVAAGVYVALTHSASVTPSPQPASPQPQAPRYTPPPSPSSAGWLDQFKRLCDPNATLDLETFKRNATHVLVLAIAIFVLDLLVRVLPIELLTVWLTFCLFAGRSRALGYGPFLAIAPVPPMVLFYLLTHALAGDVSFGAIVNFVRSAWPAFYFTLALVLIHLGDRARRVA